MAAPKGNRNAQKDGKGIQVNFYLSAQDTEAIRCHLRHRGLPEDAQSIRKFAREQSKNGIWQAIKSELPPIII